MEKILYIYIHVYMNSCIYIYEYIYIHVNKEAKTEGPYFADLEFRGIRSSIGREREEDITYV